MSFSSPLVHTHLFVVAFTSFKQDIFRCFCFSSKHTMSVFSQSVPWEQMRLSAPYRFVHYKGNNPQCNVSGFTTPSDTQAKPGWTKRSQAQALQPCLPSGLQSSNL